MHIGKCNDICPDIFIDTWKVNCKKNIIASQYELNDEIGEKHQLELTDDQKYIGDILSANGLTKKNIQERKKKGYGIINIIKNILENGFFGSFHFMSITVCTA